LKDSDRSISSAAGSPAPTCRSQESEQAWSEGPAPASSGKWRGSFAWYDPKSGSWKMCLLSLIDPSGWEPYSQRFTRAGFLDLSSGIAYRRRPSVPLTDVIGCSSWPTPRAAMEDSRNHNVYLRDGPQRNLENAIAEADHSAIGGKVNPTWVEWLMGFPPGWTDCED